MKIIFLLIILISTSNLFAKDSFYLSFGAAPVYGSAEGDSKSSLLGTAISFAAGARFKATAFEIGVKRFTISNDELGNDSYDTEIKNGIFFGGGRLFIDNIFSLKAGLASHNIEMDVYKGLTHLTSEEDDGEFIGLYGGMGIVTTLNKKSDLYFESTLYPISDVGLYFIDIEIGVRFYI